MHKLFVAGIDNVLGANLAAELADRFDVFGLSLGDPISISGCRTALCEIQDAESIRKWMSVEQPDWLVVCGPAANSSWNSDHDDDPGSEAIHAMRHWATAAQAVGCEFTVISSDGVFRGPWMFHDEQADHYCDSSIARTIRAIETEATDNCDRTLIVRTNAYGWSPSSAAPGFVESILHAIEEGDACKLDCIRHATPILANDLAEILEQAFEKRLDGLFHIPGAERTNPFAFARRLADQFGHTDVHIAADDWRTQGGRMFGQGETSLRSTSIREALGVAPPMLIEGIRRLHAQWENGYCERFGAAQPLVHEKVA
ncbi:RmlD substrate binding domain protein [Symmachiella dynata]|uniref:sugar nucleotide-binding protein n=1 Tax=Symmachiella dynata TaxID=2527995 RepID=UPI00118B6A5A|nr:sugar nucleotide-binding protein [Symmachiella dynata]QDT50209.1 RmlD substrate binding domain protein [Symmachiella dynata]